MLALPDHIVIRLAVALGVGMLIGIERERSKGQGPEREVAGVRTFTLTALGGAISLLLGDIAVFIAFAAILGVLIAIGYRRTREHDPGLTTEVAMLVTFLLGGLSMREPSLTASLAVVVAIVLAARTRLHNWVLHVLTDEEVRDGLLLAAAALVILPLIPEDPIDPWGVVRLRKLWALAVFVMAINGIGHIALRALGPRVGLALAGLLSGFVSSTATTGAMASWTQSHPGLHRVAVAGAAASSVATVIQLTVVVGLVSVATLQRLAIPLAAAGIAAVIYAGLFTIRGARETTDRETPAGRPFDPKVAVVFVLVVGGTLMISTLLTQWLGNRGLLVASAVAGFGDAHATAISAASLATSGRTTADLAALAILIGFTTNTISKTVVAVTLGDRRFAIELLPGLALMVAAAWGCWWAGG